MTVYSNISPISWQVRSDVDRGREALNFSNARYEHNEFEHAAEVVEDGEMPPLRYELAQPEARLSDAEQQQLIQGLTAGLPIEEDNRGRG